MNFFLKKHDFNRHMDGLCRADDNGPRGDLKNCLFEEEEPCGYHKCLDEEYWILAKGLYLPLLYGVIIISLLYYLYRRYEKSKTINNQNS